MKNLSINTQSCMIMGIINATVDSFSGDGIYSNDKFDLDREIESMIQNGVDIVDVGGESTRPKKLYSNVVEVSENEELERVIPIIERIKNNFEINISIDSKKHRVIDEAIKCGAEIVNDISMIEDENILKVLSNHVVFYVLLHYTKNEAHQNLIPEVLIDISKKIDLLISSGFDRSKIILDPGIGFGKTPKESKDILANIEILKKSFNLPVMVGSSRKSFIGEYTGKKIEERVFGTASTVVFSILNGANILRVHDYKEMMDVKKMTQVLKDSAYSL